MRCFIFMILLISLALFALGQASCGKRSDPEKERAAYQQGRQNGYNEGYNKGVSAVKDEISKKFEKAKERFSSGAVLAALISGVLILFGPALLEASRREFTKRLSLPPEAWIRIVEFVYTAALVSALWFCFFKSSKPLVAVAGILMAFTVWPFWFEYVPAVKKADTAAQKLASGKLKSLFILTLVLVLIEQILAQGI